MKKLILLSLMILMFTSVTSAVNLTENNILYLSFDNQNADDSSINSNNATSTNGETYNASIDCLLGASCVFFDSSGSDFLEWSTAVTNITDIDSDFSWNIWIYNGRTLSSIDTVFSRGDWSIIGVFDFRACGDGVANGGCFEMYDTGANKAFSSSTGAVFNQNTWKMVTGSFNAGTRLMRLWVDGVNIDNTTKGTTGWASLSRAFRIGMRATTNDRPYTGNVDEFGLWKDLEFNTTHVDALFNGGLGFNPYAVIPVPLGNESTETLAVSKQIGSVTFTTTPTLINDVSFNLTNDSLQGYYSHVLEAEKVTGTGSGELFCEAILNGVQIANFTETFTGINNIRNLYLVSQNVTYVNGTNNESLQCSRLSGGGQYNVRKTVSIGHVMIDEDLVAIQNEFFLFNLTGLPTNFTELDSFNFTTSNFTFNPNVNVSIILDWTAQYNYSTDGNMSVMLQIDGVNCSTYQLERSAGDVALVGGTCAYRNNLTPSTDFEVKIFGQDSGGVVFMNIFAKEIRLQQEEMQLERILSANVTSRALNQINTSPITGGSFIINNTDHAIIDISIQAGILVRSNNGSGTVFFRVVTTGAATQNSSLYQVDVDENGSVVFLQDVIEDVGIGIYNVTIEGACSTGDCTITAADGVIYLTNIISEVTQGFNVSAFDNFDNTSIDNFSVTIGTGATFFTTLGSLIVFSGIPLENLTVNSTNNGGYFPRSIINHNTSFDLNVSMNQTIIGFSQAEIITGSILSGVNFTIDGVTQDIFNLRAGEFNVTARRDDYFNLTSSITVIALQNGTVALTDMFNLLLNVTVFSAVNGSQLLNFSGDVNLAPLSLFTTTFFTTNGLAQVGLLQNRTYNVTLDPIPGFATTDNVINFTSSQTSVFFLNANFTIFTNNSISFEIFDTATNALFVGQVNVTLLGSTLTIDDQTSNGTLFIDNLNDDTYQISFVSNRTDIVNLFVTVVSGSHQNVTVFLSTENELKDFLVQDNLGVFQPDVILTFLQVINGSSSTVGQAQTDFSGRSSIFLNENITYQFFAQKTGFVTFFGNVTPTEPEYTVIIFRDTAGIPSSVFDTLTWSTPFTFETGDSEALAELIINSADGSLEIYGINASYLGQNFSSIESSIPQGSILNINITNIDVSSQSFVVVTYFFKVVGQPISVWNATYFLENINSSNVSLTGGLFADLQALDNTNAIKGLTGFIIIVVLVLIFGALGRDVTPTIVGALIGLGINWFFTLMPRELLVISMGVLLIILVADNVGGGR